MGNIKNAELSIFTAVQQRFISGFGSWLDIDPLWLYDRVISCKTFRIGVFEESQRSLLNYNIYSSFARVCGWDTWLNWSWTLHKL